MGGRLFEGLMLIRGWHLFDNLLSTLSAYLSVGAYSRGGVRNRRIVVFDIWIFCNHIYLR